MSFGLERSGWTLADSVALWLASVGMMIAYWDQKRAAALLLVRYVLWVTFAPALNAELYRRNA